jgi:hypothetical protein
MDANEKHAGTDGLNHSPNMDGKHAGQALPRSL